jgi:phenylpyruvate tautomerase PptA (4-oxalocrotonate tautomerase family)
MDESHKGIEPGRARAATKRAVALSRRAVLKTAAVAAGSVASTSTVLAQPVATVGFGVPMVELYVPAGALTSEQKSDLIKSVTDVIVNAVKPSPEQAKRLWVEIFESAEGGWGVGGNVFVPRSR